MVQLLLALLVLSALAAWCWPGCYRSQERFHVAHQKRMNGMPWRITCGMDLELVLSAMH